jgi:CheY-like chemotaxis protein/HPt (histidine-containing phosphotransfer) domain-containing protein
VTESQARQSQGGTVAPATPGAAELAEDRARAEDASRARSEFLANISHELRTPMNGILGMTELALATELTAEQREYLVSARDAAASLMRIINDLLDFARMGSGPPELAATSFHLRDCVEDALRPLAGLAERNGLAMACRIAPGVPEHLVGDPGRLRQILDHLVGNAVKFTRTGRIDVTVEVERRQERDVWLHLAVRDTGIGIASADGEEIFEAFQQADGSSTRRFGGTGLGLAITRRLAEAMDGRVWFDSTVGVGSTFHLTVRLGVGRGSAEAPALPDVESLRGLHALVVDDRDANRRALCETLAKWLLRQRVRQGRAFPLVLMDASMPRMSGFELAEQIKADPSLATATVMMLSAAGQRGDAARCLELGVSAYLSKPIQPSELLAAVRTAMAAEETDGPRLITRHSLREGRRQRSEGSASVPGSDPPRETRAPARGQEVAQAVNPPLEGVDIEGVLDRVGGDRRLLAELCEMFHEHRPRWVERIREALAKRNAPALEQTAHTVKGAVGNFAAELAVQAAEQLEHAARAGDFSRASGASGALETELAQLAQALRQLQEGAKTCGC